MTPKFSSLFLYRTGQSKSTTKLFITECSPEQEKKLGRLFGILEINYPDENNEEIITNLIEIIEKEYYESEKLDIETNFEKTLEKINQKLLELIEEKEIAFDPQKLNFLVGVLKNLDLYLSQSGTINAFLIHQVENETKMINIVTEKTIPSSLLKVFTHIINGTIGLNDAIFLTTESILDYISLDKLRKTIELLPPQSAAEHLKNLLAEVNGQMAFAAIIVKPTSQTLKSTSSTKSLSSRASLEELTTLEKKTEKLLTPSLWPKVKNSLDELRNYLSKIILKRKEIKIILPAKKSIKLTHQAALEKISYRDNKKQLAKIFVKLSKTTFYLVTKILKIIWSGLLIMTGNKKLPLDATRQIKTKIHQKINQVANKSQEQINKSLFLFKRLPKISKILLVTSLIFILLFIQSLIWLETRQKKTKENETYERLITQIEKRQNSANASLIYEDENKAKIYLLEAQNLIKELPQKTKEQKEKFSTLNLEIQNQLEKIRHVINLSLPTIIYDFNNLTLNENEKILTQGLITDGVNLYSYGENNIYKLNLEGQQITKELTTNEKIIFASSSENKKILFYQTPNIFSLFNKENKTLTPIKIKLANVNYEIKDLKIYNKKLYLLDTKNNQIYKHSPEAQGFGEGSPWRKDPTVNLTKAISLAIDGYIYILKEDGEIYKMLTGNLESFKLSIDPPLAKATKIFTSSENDYLYILDPGGKRVVVLEKNGNTKVQYYSDKFDHLQDFIVLEKQKKIYLLNGSQVYEIAINHL